MSKLYFHVVIVSRVKLSLIDEDNLLFDTVHAILLILRGVFLLLEEDLLSSTVRELLRVGALTRRVELLRIPFELLLVVPLSVVITVISVIVLIVFIFFVVFIATEVTI